MGKATLTIAIGGTYDGKAMEKAEKALQNLNAEAARHAGGMSQSFMTAGDSLIKLGANMQSTGDKIASFGTSITKATAPIAGIGAAAVKMAADYENAVAKVYTIMDKHVMTTEEMSKSILDLSTATGKSATELADATYQALSASVSTEKVAGFVEDAVKLAKAGFTETATAVDTLTTVINAYGYSADDAQMISDKLVQTQNKGKTTVDELAQSIGQVIPTAAAYNVNLDNLCSGYVALTKQGINTANATTMLNGMMTELADSESAVNIGLKEMTGKTFGELMASGMSLGDVIQLLSDAVGGNSEEFANLWGNVRAAKGALAIANGGAQEFNETMAQMADSTGLVDAALEDLATPMSKANKAINAMKNTGILLGEEIIGAAVPSLEKLSEMAQDLYKWFSELDEGTKQNIVRMGALAVAIGPAITAFGKLYGGVGKMITLLGQGMQKVGMFGAAMKTAEAEMRAAGAQSVSIGDKMKGAAEKTGLMTKATNLLKGSLAMLGVGAAIAAIGLLVQKLIEWKEHTDQVNQATTGMETALGSAQAAYDAMRPSVEGATKALENNAISAQDALKSQADLAKSMSDTWKDVGTNAAMVDNYAQTIQELGGKGELTKEEMVRLKNAVDGFNQLTGSSIEIVNNSTGELNMQKDAILGVAEAYKEEAKAAAAKEMLVEVNKQVLQDEMALKKAKDALASAEEQYQTALREYPESAFSYGQAVNAAQREVDEMSAALESAKRTEQELVDVMAQGPAHFKTVEDALASCGASIEGLGTVTDEQLNAIRTNFDGTLTSIYNTCVAQGVNIPEGLAQGIESNAERPKGSMRDLTQSVIDVASTILESHSPSQVMFRLGTDVDEGLSNGLDGSSDKPKNSMESIARSIVNAVTNLPNDARVIGGRSGSQLSSGLSSMAGSVAGAAASLASSALGGISRSPSEFSYTGHNAADSYSSAIGYSSAYGEGNDLAWSARDGLDSVDAYDAGWNFADGFASGMCGPDIWNTAWDIGYSALSAIKSALGIWSPSREAMKVGEFFGEGAIIGMRSTERDIEAEADRMSSLMGLDPAGFGEPAQAGLAASHRDATMGTSYVTMNVTVNVNAGSAPEARAAGTNLAEALYEELSRKMGSSLWPVSYSTA
jgi:TP901 family phage tail tape measure protein